MIYRFLQLAHLRVFQIFSNKAEAFRWNHHYDRKHDQYGDQKWPNTAHRAHTAPEEPILEKYISNILKDY